MGMRNKKGQFVKGSHWRKRKPWWNKKWLYKQYRTLRKSANEIAFEGGVGETAILYWLQKHKIPRWSISEVRKHKHWGSTGSDNPMWNRCGELNPRWLGGVTPERQAFYVSREWKQVCSAVWKRDGATCQRCSLRRGDSDDIPFHIHHVRSFADRDLRADENNLILLCEVCHRFVHSRKNTKHEYLS